MYDDGLLRKVAVRVHSGEEHGSGWIVPSIAEGRFYCLTAKHCVDKGSIRLFLITDDNKGEPLGYTDIIESPDENCDAAILLVDYPPERYPRERVFIGRANKLYEEGGLAGFPSSRPGKLVPYSGKFRHIDSCGKTIYMRLADVNLSLKLLHEQISGVSGGGFFVVDDGDEYKLLGIETELTDMADTFNEVQGPTIEVFDQLLQSKDWPALARPRYRYASFLWNQGRNVLTKKLEYYGHDAWVDTAVSESLIREIRSHLICKGERPLLICGFSGIGKTRTVLQACTENPELSNALIFDSYAQFSSDFESGLRNYSRASASEPIYLIVDDVSFDEWEDLRRCLLPYQNIRAVAIAEMGLDEAAQYARSDPYMMQMVPHDEADVVKIIHHRYPSLSQEDLHAIYRLSDNDLRFALLIADEYAKSGNRDVWAMQTQRSAMQIAERIMDQVVGDEYVDIVRIFSLFVDFGYQGFPKQELEFLRDYFNLNEALLIRAVNFCADHRLGIKRGNYFELSPRAMARLLFSEYHVHLIRDYLDFMNRIPTDELRRRFIMRARECGRPTWEEVKDALVSWFQDKYGRAALVVSSGLLGVERARLSVGSSTEMMTYVEFIPEDGLPWMKHLIERTPDSILGRFSGVNGRREFVWACEHLACFQEHFNICEEILFALSQHEAEPGISNNSRGVWSELFGLLTSNTEVSFKTRFEFLLSRMRAQKGDQNNSLFASAMDHALSWQGTRLLPPKMVGGRLTPENWAGKHIHDLGDIIDTHQWTLTALQNNIKALPDDMRRVVFQRLKDRMVDFTSPLVNISAPGLRDDYRQTLELFAKDADQRTEIVIAINAQLEREKRLQKRNEAGEADVRRISYLTQWREALMETDFVSRLKVCLAKDAFSNKEEHLCEIKNLAAELIAKDDAPQILERLFLADDMKDYSFGPFVEMVGELDAAYSLAPVINANFSNSRNTFSERYYFGIYNREKKLPEFILSQLDTCITQNPKGVLHMSIIGDRTNDGFRRIFRLLKEGVIDNYMLDIGERQWVEFLSLEQIEAILELLWASGTNDGVFCFFHVGRAWLKAAPDPDLENFLFKHTRDLPLEILRRYSYEFVLLIEEMPERLLRECLLLVIQSIDYSSWISHQPYQVSFIKNHICNAYAEDMAFEICNCLKAQFDRMPYVPSSSLLVGLFPPELILHWIEADSSNRAEVIAYHLPAPSLSERFVPEITLSVLERYGQNETVFRRFLSGIHAYKTYRLDDVVQNCQKTFAVLASYEDHPLAEIRRWAEYEKKRLESDLEKNRQLEAMDHRLRDD